MLAISAFGFSRASQLTSKFNRGFSGLFGDFDARMRWMKGTEPVEAARCL